MKSMSCLVMSLRVVALSSVVLACDNETRHEGGRPAKADERAVASADGHKASEVDPETIMSDYPKIYCETVGRLQMRADVAPELAFFCPDGVPSGDMRDMRQRLLDSGDGRTVLQVISATHDEAGETSDFTLVWGYYVKLRPFVVKSRPLYRFIAKDFEKGGLKLQASTERRPDEELDSGLHLWSADMSYDLTVKATSGIDLITARKTQYNLYQVQSGNEEMGLGVEALSDPASPDYSRSVMLNLSFNDGQGYNDGRGGTITLNLLRLRLGNRGFPESVADAVNVLGQFLADSMFEGLTKPE